MLLLLLALLSGWYVWPHAKSAASRAEAGAAKGGRRGRDSGAVPVTAAKVRSGNIGVYITGLGSVTPLNTVTLKSRVDGQLMNVHFNEGDFVKRGDVLAEIDSRPFEVQLEQAEGQLARDAANLQNARVDLDRYQRLFSQNVIAEQQVATQKALVAQDEGVLKSDQGQIDSAKLNLVYCRIVAPISGRVGLRLVDPGNVVHASDANGLLVITQVDPISVVFSVAEDDLPAVLRKLSAGQHLPADAYDRDNQTRIGRGTLTTVDNQIDPSTGSLRLRASFDNSGQSFFPNQFVNIRLLVELRQNVALVPSAVIQRSTSSTYVCLVKDDQTVTIRQVSLGVTEGDYTQILSGVKPGDVLVMTGVDKLVEGSKVTVEMARAQPAAPAGGRRK